MKDDNGQVIADTTMRYWYDAGGRRTKFVNGTDTISYTYGADARLAKLKVKWPAAANQPADSFFFYWDGLGRRDSVVYATPQAHVSFGYDKDGHLRMACSKHLATHPNGQDRLEHRVRYTSMDADGQPLAYRRYYRGMTSPACSSNLQYQADFADYTYDERHHLRTATGNTYTYDSSGNRISTVGLDTLVYFAASNRLARRYGWTGNPPQLWLERALDYDANGSRTGEHLGVDGSRLYYYNALGQQWALKHKVGVDWLGPFSCRYDALGRQTKACAQTAAGGRAAFDGTNVVRLGSSTWRFVHGPGVDDPLVGLYYSGSYQKHFYLTDGRGRSLAFTDAQGNDYLDHVTYTQNGGNRAGAIDRSHTFANSRAETVDIPDLSFYRNRYYDQTTGQWTQEDPIGIAGGVHLYEYVGNNPTMFTDPFGLCKDERGNWRRCTVTWIGGANADITDEARDLAQMLADSADVDLILSSGRREGSCDDSLHNCGKAFDISAINGTERTSARVGSTSPRPTLWFSRSRTRRSDSRACGRTSVPRAYTARQDWGSRRRGYGPFGPTRGGMSSFGLIRITSTSGYTEQS